MGGGGGEGRTKGGVDSKEGHEAGAVDLGEGVVVVVVVVVVRVVLEFWGC